MKLKNKSYHHKFHIDIENILDGFVLLKVIIDQNKIPVDFVILKVNDGFANLAGLSKRSLLGKKVSRIFPYFKSAYFDWHQALEKTFLSGKTYKSFFYSKVLKRRFFITISSYFRKFLAITFEEINDVKLDLDLVNQTLESNPDFLNEIALTKDLVNPVEQYQTLLDGTQDAMFLINIGSDGKFRFHMVNHRYEIDTELTLEQVRGKTPRDLFGEEMGSFIESKYQYCVDFKTTYSYEETFYLRGAARSGQTVLSPVIRDNTVVQIVGSTREITEQKKAQDELNQYMQHFKALVENSPDIIARLDRNLKYMYINPAVQRELGIAPEKFIGKTDRELGTGDKDLKWERTLKTVVETGKEKSVIIKRKTPKEIKYYFSRIVPEFDNRGSLISLMCVSHDITERRKFEDKIKFLSFHDKLTGLYNRAYFEEELLRLNTGRQLPLSVIMIDVNGLKLANDAFGHQEGDKLLVKTAVLLKQICRKEEIICRWGGDEFIVLLPKTNERATMEVCNRIKKGCLNQKSAIMPLSLAIGSATKKEELQNIQTTLKIAEDRMYRNKLLENRSSRSSIILFLQESLQERTLETKEHQQRLKDLAVLIGEKLGFSGNELDEFILLASLHDIGKIAISEAILLKPTGLTKEEWQVIKKHSEIGYRIAKTTPELTAIAEQILTHHERWDGTGYPQGIKGANIPLMSRLLAIMDAFDVMTNGRPYKQPVSKETAIAEIKKCAGYQFDPSLVDIFIEAIILTRLKEDKQNI